MQCHFSRWHIVVILIVSWKVFCTIFWRELRTRSLLFNVKSMSASWALPDPSVLAVHFSFLFDSFQFVAPLIFFCDELNFFRFRMKDKHPIEIIRRNIERVLAVYLWCREEFRRKSRKIPLKRFVPPIYALILRLGKIHFSISSLVGHLSERFWVFLVRWGGPLKMMGFIVILPLFVILIIKITLKRQPVCMRSLICELVYCMYV